MIYLSAWDVLLPKLAKPSSFRSVDKSHRIIWNIFAVDKNSVMFCLVEQMRALVAIVFAVVSSFYLANAMPFNGKWMV